jgi:two-component system cell cycle sensor histidine kinase/response regulator CckA
MIRSGRILQKSWAENLLKRNLTTEENSAHRTLNGGAWMSSMAVRVALAVIAIVILAYSVIGVIMTKTLISDIRARAIAKVQAPGQLLQQHVLNFDSLADRRIMTQLVGDELVDGLLVGRNKVIFHDLKPERLGNLISSFPEYDPVWFKDDVVDQILDEKQENGHVVLTSVTPIFTGDATAPYFFAVVRVALTELAREEAALTRWVVGVGAVSAILVILGVIGAVRFLVLNRVHRLTVIASRIGAGDLSTTVDYIGADELGVLERTMNSMATNLRRWSRERDEAINALRISETRFRDFAESSSDWTWEMDANLKFTEFSARVVDAIGFPISEHIGKTREQGAVDTDVNTDGWKEHLVTLQNREPFKDFQYSRRTKDDGVIWLSTSGVPIFDERGNFCGYRGTSSNITEQKTIEAQLRHSQQLEAVGQLTGGVAHDFNNLMAVMMGNLESAMDMSQTDSGLQAKIGKALSAVDKAAVLTQQLLSFSRRQILSPKVVDVRELISDTLIFLERTLGENIEIVTVFDDSVPQINIDSAIFGNALLNLALNARDAMPSGGTLTISASTVEMTGEHIGPGNEPVNGQYVLITVSDTGTGIDEGVIDRVMEPFFTTKEIGKGSGLGLSMVHGFVHQSDGYVDITSVQNSGSSISLYLPTAQKIDEDLQHIETIDVKAPGKKVVLLVEDDASVCDTVAATLSQLGYHVIIAEDGSIAMTILADNSTEIDLIFTDVVMPNNMSGIELAENVRAKRDDIKILLTSGYPDTIANDETFKSLGIELLAKPFKRAQLAAAVIRAMST